MDISLAFKYMRYGIDLKIMFKICKEENLDNIFKNIDKKWSGNW